MASSNQNHEYYCGTPNPCPLGASRNYAGVHEVLEGLRVRVEGDRESWHVPTSGRLVGSLDFQPLPPCMVDVCNASGGPDTEIQNSNIPVVIISAGETIASLSCCGWPTASNLGVRASSANGEFFCMISSPLLLLYNKRSKC